MDLQRRPATYWPEDQPVRSGTPSDGERSEMLELGKQHPAFLGGAFLPEGEEGEVEIARIVLQSVTADVVSVQARRVSHGIAYRVVDEYEGEWSWVVPKDRSEEPLTLQEMLHLLRATYMAEEDWVRGVAHGFRERSNLDGDPRLARELVDFVRVTSRFYPELEELDREEARAWAEELDGKQ